MDAAIDIRSLSGAALGPYLESVAALRMAVFREWPYLYDGDPEYEAQYLDAYARSPESVFVLAFDRGQVVGASTGIPMAHDSAALREPLTAHGIDVETVFYFGESVLLPDYRGRGLGHRFFDERERFAVGLQRFRSTAFYSVLRDMGDPRRPQEYRSLEPFWRKRGYAPCEHVVAQLEWKETWHEAREPHRLQLWLRHW